VNDRRRHETSKSRTATCHCGNIRIIIPELPNTVTTCNCSVCRRYGALWAYFTRREVTLEADENALAAYRWGDRTIDFWHCARCGCLTHYTSRENGPESRFAVNARMLPLDVIESLTVRRFDGDNTWRYLD
jgi:hypothetical protein